MLFVLNKIIPHPRLEVRLPPGSPALFGGEILMNDPQVEQQVQDEGGGPKIGLRSASFRNSRRVAGDEESTLESAGVECLLRTNTPRSRRAGLSPGARADVEAAEAILEQPIPESFEVEELEAFSSLVVPRADHWT